MSTSTHFDSKGSNKCFKVENLFVFCVWILIFSVYLMFCWFAPFPFRGIGCLGKFYNVHVWVIEFL